MAQHRVIYQAWMGHDEWSGPEQVNGSLHLSEEDRKAYIKATLGDRSGAVPAYYIRPDGEPREVEVDAQTLAALKQGRPGIRAVGTFTTTFRPA